MGAGSKKKPLSKSLKIRVLELHYESLKGSLMDVVIILDLNLT